MKKYPPGHKKYGKMGPLTKKEMDSVPMRNKDIKKLSSFSVGPSGANFDGVTGKMVMPVQGAPNKPKPKSNSYEDKMKALDAIRYTKKTTAPKKNNSTPKKNDSTPKKKTTTVRKKTTTSSAIKSKPSKDALKKSQELRSLMKSPKNKVAKPKGTTTGLKSRKMTESAKKAKLRAKGEKALAKGKTAKAARIRKRYDKKK